MKQGENGIRRMFDRVNGWRELQGLPKINHGSFRRRMATDLSYEAHASTAEIKSIMGWRSDVTVMHYIQPTDRAFVQASDRLQQVCTGAQAVGNRVGNAALDNAKGSRSRPQ